VSLTVAAEAQPNRITAESLDIVLALQAYSVVAGSLMEYRMEGK
jgi:hypothetical protein